VLIAALDDRIVRIDPSSRVRPAIEVAGGEEDLRIAIQSGAWPCRFGADQFLHAIGVGAGDDLAARVGLDGTGEEPQVERRLRQRRAQHLALERRRMHRRPAGPHADESRAGMRCALSIDKCTTC